jgi:hypothetical protein
MATRNVCVLAPTWLEYCALRPVSRAVHAGIGLRRWDGSGENVLVAGLGGALADLEPGTMVIPEWAETADGRRVTCDEGLRHALATAARTLGFPVVTGPLLTSEGIVTGDARGAWAERGFVAVDMETGLLASHRGRVAALRVILDTADRSISEDWLTPLAGLSPRLWRELIWLAVHAPRYAWRLGSVVKLALEGDE